MQDYQLGVERRCFYRGCKRYVQLWSIYSDYKFLIFELWHYERGRLRRMVEKVTKVYRLFLAGFKYDYNRGRHWDRKRK